MREDEWFVLRPQKAQAFGRPHGKEFLVRAGSTAMFHGSPNVKRNRAERDMLLRVGVLVRHTDPELLRFSRDHIFKSASRAGGIILDGNCSGPQRWKRIEDGKTLKDVREGK